jgi:hypothetical protein
MIERVALDVTVVPFIYLGTAEFFLRSVCNASSSSANLAALSRMELLSILHNTNVSIALQEGGEAAKAFCSVNFVLSEAPLDVETSVALTFLDYLLVGTDAAPLMKAINDSGLGESVVGGGTDDTLRQPTFSMGLKGVPPEDVEKVRLDHTPEAPVIHSPVNSTYSMV